LVRRPLNNRGERLALWVGIERLVSMQGTSDTDSELLDALAMCGHLVARDSVHGFLASTVSDCSPMRYSPTCSVRSGLALGPG
jgi:hypothetical protein